MINERNISVHGVKKMKFERGERAWFSPVEKEVEVVGEYTGPFSYDYYIEGDLGKIGAYNYELREVACAHRESELVFSEFNEEWVCPFCYAD